MTRSYWLLVVVLAVLGGLRASPFLLLAGILLTALGAVVHLWGRYALHGITCRRTVTPTHLELGETAQVRIEVANAKPLPLPWLRIDSPLPAALHLENQGKSDRPISYLVRLAPNDREAEQFEVRVVERGIHELGPLWLRTADPLGFKIVRSKMRSGDRIVGLPPLVPLDRLGVDPSSLSPWRLPDHVSQQSDSADQHGSIFRNRPLVLIPDLSDAHGAEVDLVLSAVRSIANAALDAGREVALETGSFLPGSRRRILVRPGRGPEQARNIAEALAGLPSAQELLTHQVVRRAVRRHDIETVVWVISISSAARSEVSERLALGGLTGAPSSADAVFGMAHPYKTVHESTREVADEAGHQIAGGVAASNAVGGACANRVEFLRLSPPDPDFARVHSTVVRVTTPNAATSDAAALGPPIPEVAASDTAITSATGSRAVDGRVGVGAPRSARSSDRQTEKDDFDSWNRTVFLPLARLLLRLSWVWPWTVLLSQIAIPGIEPGVTLGSLILLSWTGFAVGRLRLHRRKRTSSWAPFFVVTAGTLAVLGTSWLLSYREILPIWELAWLRDLGLEMLQGGPTTVRRAIAIVAAAFVCAGAVVDAEEPTDHASIWSAFISAIVLVIGQAAIVEFASDPRVHAPTSWLLFAFSVGMLALVASGVRLGNRLEPKARRPWQPG